MAHTSAPTEPNTLDAAFSDHAQRTDGAMHLLQLPQRRGEGHAHHEAQRHEQRHRHRDLEANGNHTSAESTPDTRNASNAANSATQPSALIKRPSSPPSSFRLAKLPRPLDVSSEKITTVRA